MVIYGVDSHSHTHTYTYKQFYDVQYTFFSLGETKVCAFSFVSFEFNFLWRLPIFWCFKHLRVKLCDSHGIDFFSTQKKKVEFFILVGWLVDRFGFAYYNNINLKIDETDTNEMQNCGDDKSRVCVCASKLSLAFFLFGFFPAFFSFWFRAVCGALSSSSSSSLISSTSFGLLLWHCVFFTIIIIGFGSVECEERAKQKTMP